MMQCAPCSSRIGEMAQANTDAGTQGQPNRSRTETIVRRVLLVPITCPTPREPDEGAERLFSLAMVISGLRCTLSYVVIPFVLPLIGLGASSLSPYIGLPIGIVALYFDVKGIRRFWISDHRLRWQMSLIYVGVILLVLYLVTTEIIQLVH